MNAVAALPTEIQPLDRSIPYVDERSGRAPRKGRAFPDPRREHNDEPRKPHAPAVPSADADGDAEPVRPRVDVHVCGHFLPTRQVGAPAARVH